MHQEDPAEGASARLRQHGLVPRKRLGQNFLRDRSYLRVLLDAADLRREDEALEIGAGTGVLTEAWSPGGPGAVLMLEVPDQAGADRIVGSFPLVQAGLITTEVIPLHPIDLA